MSRRRIDPEKFYRALGKRIKELRKARNWTLEACESHGYPSWRHLQTIEAGAPMRLETLINVANLFGMHPSEILEDI